MIHLKLKAVSHVVFFPIRSLDHSFPPTRSRASFYLARMLQQGGMICGGDEQRSRNTLNHLEFSSLRFREFTFYKY